MSSLSTKGKGTLVETVLKGRRVAKNAMPSVDLKPQGGAYRPESAGQRVQQKDTVGGSDMTQARKKLLQRRGLG